MAFQNIIIQGNIGKIDTLAYANNGTAYLKLSVAISEKKGQEDNTQWFPVKVFKGTAETISKFFNVGDTILLNGKMNFFNYEKDGVKKYSYEMIAFTFSFCGKTSGQDNQQSNQNQQPQNQGFQQQHPPQTQFQQPGPDGFQQQNGGGFQAPQQQFQSPPDDQIPF